MYQSRQISISRHDSISHDELCKDYWPVTTEKKCYRLAFKLEIRKIRNLLPARKLIRTETSKKFDKPWVKFSSNLM